MVSKEVGNKDVVSDKFNGTDYFVWGMKEPNYVVKIMGTGGSLDSEECKEIQYNWKDRNESNFKSSCT